MNNQISIIKIGCLLVFLLFSCKKKSEESDCSCSTDSSNRYATYTNFGGLSYYASLYYEPNYNQNAWFISVQATDPYNSGLWAILKICNPNIPSIKAITDTSSKQYNIPVKFAGYLKDPCPANSSCFGFTIYPETICSYITIDSLVIK